MAYTTVQNSVETLSSVNVTMILFFFLISGKHHQECVVPKSRHQSPEWTILSHVSCFIQGEVIGFQVSGLAGQSSTTQYKRVLVVSSSSSRQKLLRSFWHLFHRPSNVAEQRETLCLDNSRKVWLLGCPSHIIIILHMVISFDSYQLSQTPSVESIDLVYNVVPLLN